MEYQMLKSSDMASKSIRVRPSTMRKMLKIQKDTDWKLVTVVEKAVDLLAQNGFEVKTSRGRSDKRHAGME